MVHTEWNRVCCISNVLLDTKKIWFLYTLHICNCIAKLQSNCISQLQMLSICTRNITNVACTNYIEAHWHITQSCFIWKNKIKHNLIIVTDYIMKPIF